MASLQKPPKKYTRVGETRTVAEFFTSLYAYAAASQVDKAGSNCMVAMYATLKDCTFDNPMANADSLQRGLMISAATRLDFPMVHPDALRPTAADGVKTRSKIELEAELKELQQPFLDRALEYAQQSCFYLIKGNVDSELQTILDTMVPSPLQDPQCGTKAVAKLHQICVMKKQNSQAIEIAKAVASATSLAQAPSTAPTVITGLAASARTIGNKPFTIDRLFTVLAALSLTNSSLTTHKAVTIGEALLNDEKKTLSDAEALISEAINTGAKLGSDRPSMQHRTAAQARPHGDSRPQEVDGTELIKGQGRNGSTVHRACIKCGSYVSLHPDASGGYPHTAHTCPFDTEHKDFRYGQRASMVIKSPPAATAIGRDTAYRDRAAAGAGAKRRNPSPGHDLREGLSRNTQRNAAVAALEAGHDTFLFEGRQYFVSTNDSGEILASVNLDNYSCLNSSSFAGFSPDALPILSPPKRSLGCSAHANDSPSALDSSSSAGFLPDTLSILSPPKRSLGCIDRANDSPSAHLFKGQQGRSLIAPGSPAPLSSESLSSPTSGIAPDVHDVVPLRRASPVKCVCDTGDSMRRAFPALNLQPPFLSTTTRRQRASVKRILDCGAEDHMSPFATGPTQASTLTIKGVSNKALQNVRQGDLSVDTVTENGVPLQLKLPRSLVHPGLDFVLVSVHRLLSAGYRVLLEPADSGQRGGHIQTPQGDTIPLLMDGKLWTIPASVSSCPIAHSNPFGVLAATSTTLSSSSVSGPTPSSSTSTSRSASASEPVQSKDHAVDDPTGSSTTVVSADTDDDHQRRLVEAIHNAHNHCDTARVIRIAKHMDPADPKRPTFSAIHKFRCPSCVTMKSRRPSVKQANPSRVTDRGHAPGSVLHIDPTGGLEQTVEAIDGSVDVWGITDDASGARWALPTKSKTTASLVRTLQRFQAKSRVPIQQIFVDGALAKGDIATWAADNDVDIACSPPNEPRSNGRSEATVNILKDSARVLRQTSGAGIPFHFLAMQWAAMNNNFVSTSTDPSGQHRAPVDIWPDLPYRHRDLRHDLPFGCRAWRHEGKDYQNRPHWQRRARPCVFVGWSLDTPSYLLYDIDGHHLFEGTYVTFDETNFPLMDLLLAGETHTADKQIDVDGWRVSANTSIQEADDFTLAHWCAGKQILVTLPADYYPRDAPHRWITRCISVPTARKSAPLSVTLKTEDFTGSVSDISDYADRDFVNTPRLFDLVISSTIGSHATLRRALNYTYPTAVKLHDLATMSFARSSRPPGHPRLLDGAQLPSAQVPCPPQATSPNTAVTGPKSILRSTLPSRSRPTAYHVRWASSVFDPTPRHLRSRSFSSVQKYTQPPKSFTSTQQRRTSPRLHPARVAGGARVSSTKVPVSGCHFIQNSTPPVTPKNLREAKRGPDWPRWEEAINKELAGLQRLKIYSTLPRSDMSPEAQLLHSMYVFKVKADGSFKVRLVVQGHRQRPLPPASETFAATPSMDAMRAMTSVAVQQDDELDHWDVTQAFCQSDEFPDHVKLYMAPPPLAEADPTVVWRLLRPLYGLAIAPRAWYDTFKAFLLSTGWKPVAFEECLFTIETKSGYRMNLGFFVDDILFSYSKADQAEADAFKQKMFSRFEGKDLGPVQRFLGIEIVRDRTAGTIKLHQENYVRDLLTRFKLDDAHHTLTPLTPNVHMTKEDSPETPDHTLGSVYREAVGAINWLAVACRPDLSHAAEALAAFSSNPGQAHWKEVKHCLRYLINTADKGITYTRESSSELANTLFGFCDSDWAACLDTRRSIGAYVLMLNGGAVSWRSKKQRSISMSTAESEFQAASAAAQTTLWLRRILDGLQARQRAPTMLLEDNQACILLSENPSHKGRVRHIDLHIHNLRDHVANKVVRLVTCPTFHMTADLLTKPLPSPCFIRHREVMLGNAPPTAPLLAPVRAFAARVSTLYSHGLLTLALTSIPCADSALLAY